MTTIKPSPVFTSIAFFWIGVLLTPGVLLGQGTCPVTTVKAKSIKGNVIWNDQLQQPIKKARIEIKRLGDLDELVGSRETDDTGYFEFPKLPKGRYGVTVQVFIDGQQLFPGYGFGVNVRRSSDLRGKSRILVKIGPDCFSSEAGVTN